MSLTYNADGQRAAKVSTDASVTGFLYDHKRLLHETEDVGGDVTNTYAAGTHDEFGDLIGEGDGQAHVYDAEANTNALLDSTGTIEAQYKYTAFGEVNAVSVDGGAWSREDWETLPLELSSHMLAGGRKQYYLDMETALYLLGSGNSEGGGRYYDPITARFLSEDPKGLQQIQEQARQKKDKPGTAADEAPAPMADAAQANLYPYAQNDPVNKLDPGGQETPEQKKKREDEDRRRQEAEQAKKDQQSQQHDPKTPATDMPTQSGTAAGPAAKPVDAASGSIGQAAGEMLGAGAGTTLGRGIAGPAATGTTPQQLGKAAEAGALAGAMAGGGTPSTPTKPQTSGTAGGDPANPGQPSPQVPQKPHSHTFFYDQQKFFDALPPEIQQQVKQSVEQTWRNAHPGQPAPSFAEQLASVDQQRPERGALIYTPPPPPDKRHNLTARDPGTQQLDENNPAAVELLRRDSLHIHPRQTWTQGETLQVEMYQHQVDENVRAFQQVQRGEGWLQRGVENGLRFFDQNNPNVTAYTGLVVGASGVPGVHLPGGEAVDPPRIEPQRTELVETPPDTGMRISTDPFPQRGDQPVVPKVSTATPAEQVKINPSAADPAVTNVPDPLQPQVHPEPLAGPKPADVGALVGTLKGNAGGGSTPPADQASDPAQPQTLQPTIAQAHDFATSPSEQPATQLPLQTATAQTATPGETASPPAAETPALTKAQEQAGLRPDVAKAAQLDPGAEKAAQVNKGAAKGAPLKGLHPDSTYARGTAKMDLDSVRKMSTDDIIKSLKPGSDEPLLVKPDGTIMDGNTRVKVLQERGVDVNKLPRTTYQAPDTK